MIEFNPQLQSKIFDSLLLHMKAEKDGARRPRSGARAPSPHWAALASDLSRLGLEKTVSDALVSWANSQAEMSRQSPVKIRLLHPMEREFLSTDAYDYLLELYRLGLIGPPQLEQLIENCAYLTSLPASRGQIRKMALRTVSETLDQQGLGTSH